jgi:hypothetical protein
MQTANHLAKNGRFFVPPADTGENFKALFKRLAAAGAGRPVDINGFPEGPWTPDLLTDAISQIDANRAGVELRTVQLWFQDNDKGISSDNIRWLARVFGCNDPEATSSWQAELSASHARLIAERRLRRRDAQSENDLPAEAVDDAAPVDDQVAVDARDENTAEPEPARSFSLAQRSEAMIGRQSVLDLPSLIFAGAVALGFSSLFLGIHSVTYDIALGMPKQVGFLFAPNWTLLFMVFMPLFVAFSSGALSYWKTTGRRRLAARDDSAAGDEGWETKVESSSLTYWAVLFICVFFAGIFQWVSVRLKPLVQGGGNYAIDWGTISLVRPDVISNFSEAAFTALAYSYMAASFYVFFVANIIIYTIASDYRDLKLITAGNLEDYQSRFADVGDVVIRAAFRCGILGILIASCMKLQAIYLATSSRSIIDWIARDFLALTKGINAGVEWQNVVSPTQYTSLLIVLVSCFTFIYTFVQIAPDSHSGTRNRMAAAIFFLILCYLSIGAFDGFSLLLGCAAFLAVYGLVDPRLGGRTGSDKGGIYVK